jgi:hypothetical protein
MKLNECGIRWSKISGIQRQQIQICNFLYADKFIVVIFYCIKWQVMHLHILITNCELRISVQKKQTRCNMGHSTPCVDTFCATEAYVMMGVPERFFCGNFI